MINKNEKGIEGKARKPYLDLPVENKRKLLEQYEKEKRRSSSVFSFFRKSKSPSLVRPDPKTDPKLKALDAVDDREAKLNQEFFSMIGKLNEPWAVKEKLMSMSLQEKEEFVKRQRRLSFEQRTGRLSEPTPFRSSTPPAVSSVYKFGTDIAPTRSSTPPAIFSGFRAGTEYPEPRQPTAEETVVNNELVDLLVFVY
jgi:hypothetical protein